MFAAILPSYIQYARPQRSKYTFHLHIRRNSATFEVSILITATQKIPAETRRGYVRKHESKYKLYPLLAFLFSTKESVFMSPTSLMQITSAEKTSI